MNTLEIEHKENYAVVSMKRGKVNAINHEMVSELSEVFGAIENSDLQGVVLSGQPHFFSAGLDLIELIAYNEGEIQSFFRDFGALYQQLVRFPKPFISAITGHAPAGGCVLAVTSDNRFMAEGEKYRIGLNEVAVNIQISQGLIDAYTYWIGEGMANRYILEGKLLTAEEAQVVGLVDALVPLEKVLETAENKLKLYLKADQEIWLTTKKKLRSQWLVKLEREGEDSLQEAARLWWKPEIRTKMEAFVKSFSNKK